MMIADTPKASDFPNPHFIQGSDSPVFRGTIANELIFQCKKCGHVLIDNYDKNDFLGVEIKCFKYQSFTMTPSIEKGEIFSLRCVNIGNEGAFLINGTIDVPTGVTITSGRELVAASELTSPRARVLNLDLSDEGLDFFVKKYDEITGNLFSIQNRILSKSGEDEAIRFPFTWSVRNLRACIDDGLIDFDDQKVNLSLTWLRIFGDVVGRWEHHPRFISVARDLGKKDSFFHTAAQFIIAAYLYEHGNVIGLSLEDLHGEANPDLYVRGVGKYEKIYIEVKSPKVLNEFIGPASTSLGVEAPIKSCIKRSVKQINKNRPGALVIFSGLKDHRTHAELKRCADNWLVRYGRNRKSLSAVVVMSIQESPTLQKYEAPYHPITFWIDPVLNPHFDGDQPIRTE